MKISEKEFGKTVNTRGRLKVEPLVTLSNLKILKTKALVTEGGDWVARFCPWHYSMHIIIQGSFKKHSISLDPAISKNKVTQIYSTGNETIWILVPRFY